MQMPQLMKYSYEEAVDFFKRLLLETDMKVNEISAKVLELCSYG